MKTRAVEEIIYDIICAVRSKQTVVFCGAGVSFFSGIPLVPQTVNYILEQTSASSAEKDTILEASIPFEAFIELLHGQSDINSMLDMYKLGSPCTSHKLLAHLTRVGYIKTICTTNFDCHIETAFEAIGMRAGTDYFSFHTEQQFDKIDWDDPCPKLIKIHGSIEDKSEMAITMGRVAAKYFSLQRQAIINQLFSRGKHQNVLVIGYSCSDIFDISRHIQAIDGNYKKVYFIDHCDDDTKEYVEDITERKHKNPFKAFKGSLRIYYNTDNLIKKLWVSLIEGEEYQDPQCPFLPWRKKIDEWSQQSENSKNEILGNIFFNIAEYQTAKKYLTKSLNEVKQSFDQVRLGKHIDMLGSLQEKIGIYDKAVNLHRQAAEVAKNSDDRLGEIAALNNLATTYGKMGNYVSAIDSLLQSLKIIDTEEEYDTAAYCLGNLGLIYGELGQHNKATEYHMQALELSKTKGDKRSEAWDLNNLGIAFEGLEDWEQAIIHYRSSLDIKKQIGDNHGTVNSLNNIGNIYCRKGKLSKAMDYMKQALELSRRIGDKKTEGIILYNIANSLSIFGKAQQALNYCSDAMIISEEVIDERNILNILICRGTIYNKQKKTILAKQVFSRALDISRKLGDRSDEALILCHLGNTYNLQHEFRAAIKILEQAISLAQKISDKKNEGRAFNLMGISYWSLKKYEQAQKLFLLAIDVFSVVLDKNDPLMEYTRNNLSEVTKDSDSLYY